MEKNQKGIAPIVIILIIIAILGGGILAWWYFGAPKEEAKFDPLLTTTKLATLPPGSYPPEPGKYPQVSHITFSPNGRRVAYGVITEEGNKWFVVIDGKEGKAYDYVAHPVPEPPVIYPIFDTRLTFSPNSQHIAYEAKEGDKWFVVIDGKEGKAYDFVYHLTFSPDSQHLAYKARGGGKWFVVVDGKEGKAYDEIFPPLIFSPDGKYIAYGALLGNELWWIVDKVGEFESKFWE